MKTLLILLATPVLAQVNDHAAWRHVQTVTATSAGLIRLILPGETMNGAGPRLEDLRLVDAGDAEVPYVLERLTLPALETWNAPSFHASLVGSATVLEIETGKKDPLHELLLTSPSPDFIKEAKLEGSNNSTEWHPILTTEVLFRQGNMRKLNLSFAPGAWERLRVTVDDVRSPPVAFTSASVRLYREASPSITEPATVMERSEVSGITTLTLQLPTSNSQLGVLRLTTPEPVFSRHASVESSGAPVAAGDFFRIALAGLQTEALELPLNFLLKGNVLTVRINNGDSPPLEIKAIDVSRYPQALLFHASAPGVWRLFSGNSAAPAPNYDLAALRSKLQSTQTGEALIGPLESNPSFRQDANAPDATGTGAVIDLNGWSRRKRLVIKDMGIIEVELDQEVLAEASLDLRDLRVMQAGRQVPFLIEHTGKLTTIPVPFILEPDPKRPTTSRWVITLPLARLPVQQVTIASPTPLFERHMVLSTLTELHGQKRELVVSSARWLHKPGSTESLNLNGSFRTEMDKLILTTDDGDNSPISIQSITMAHAKVHLLFKIDSLENTHLYFGNPRARTPQYDLSLIRHELSAANRIKASLNLAEQLKPDTAKYKASEAGSPWLWAALTVVMGGLLWMVARLLPKPGKADG